MSRKDPKATEVQLGSVTNTEATHINKPHAIVKRLDTTRAFILQ